MDVLARATSRSGRSRSWRTAPPRHQRADRAQGRQDRADHHRGLPRLPGDRPRQPARLLQPALRQAGAVRAPPPAPRGAGPAGADGQRARAARPRRAARDPRRLPVGGRRGGGDLPAPLLREPGPRAAGAASACASSGRRCPSSPRTRSAASGASTSARAPSCSPPTCSRLPSATSSRLADAARRRGLRAASCTSCSRTAASTRSRTRRRSRSRWSSPGPASGFWGAAELGRLVGEPNVLALDIGGTTAKCSLIEGGEVKIISDYWIEREPPLGRLPDPGPGRRPGRDRQRRRQHRLGRRLRQAPRRSAVGRGGAGAGLLRPRRHRGDND